MNIVDVNSWNNVLDKMIIIGGSARSGTTIMGKLINSLQNVEYQFEPPMLISLLLKKNELSGQSLKELLQFYFFDNYLLDSLAGRNINLNKNDDSCILHVKSEDNIKNRHKKSLTRVELEELVKKITFSFKLPEIVFFLNTLDNIFPQNKKILMHRNPNDVINSLVKKGWFSNESLNQKHSSQVFAVEIIENIKVPYWIKEENKNFWINADELSRCAHYYKQISEEILKNANNSIIVDYDKFVNSPNEMFSSLAELIGLEYGEKTQEILDAVKFQEKKRENYLVGLDNSLIISIENLDMKLKGLSIL